jgi:hypothetical protein
VLTGDERRFAIILMGQMREPGPVDAPPGPVAAPPRAGHTEPSLKLDLPDLLAWCGEVVSLGAGTAAALVGVDGNATDEAARAAAGALALVRSAPRVLLALAAGFVESVGDAPAGPVIDRAATLLAAAAGQTGIRVDDTMAALLGGRYEIAGGWLVGERAASGARLLLGRPTPFAGRDKELMLLLGTWRECLVDRVARSVLVTAGSGAGKTRLGQELVARIEGAPILSARGDPVGAGSAFMLARQLLQQPRRPGPPACEEFLGELTGQPAARPSPTLRAARHDPRLMSEWLKRSFVEWVGVQAATPTVILLDDLHWGDAPTVAYLDAALRAHHGRPLLVVGLGRPEVHDLFPRPWPSTQVLALGALTGRAVEQIARAVLGKSVAPEVLERLVARAAGHAFYLEELIRHVAAGESIAGAPETVLAMVQARLGLLSAESRRALKAASVLGDTFCRTGVEQLAGEAPLDALVAEELIEPRGDDYVFRHALVRDAAYALLTAEDRRTAHLRAAQYLESGDPARPAPAPLQVAEHFEQGEAPERAIPWLLGAARTAYDGAQVEAADALCERAIGHGATGATLGALRALQVLVCGWTGDNRRGRQVAAEAMALLPAGSTLWCTAAAATALYAMFDGDMAELFGTVAVIIEHQGPIEETGPSGLAQLLTVMVLSESGQGELLDPCVDRLLDSRQRRAAPKVSGASDGSGVVVDPIFAAYVTAATGFRCGNQGQDYDLGRVLRHLRQAQGALETAGDPLGKMVLAFLLSWNLSDAGAWAEAEQWGRAAEALAARSGAPRLAYYAREGRIMALLAGGQLAAVKAEAAALLAEPIDLMCEAVVRSCLATAFLEEGDLAEAERLAVMAWGTYLPRPSVRGLHILGRLALRANDPAKALAHANEGLPLLLTIPTFLGTSELHLLRIEALLALGNRAQADQALDQARARILRIAATLDPGQRPDFLGVGVHARTLELCNRR